MATAAADSIVGVRDPASGFAERAVLRLSAIEMWERYSYYNMFALLPLFLVAPLATGGMAWSGGDALRFFGLYLLVVSLAPLAGGYIADRWLPGHRALQLGAVGLMAGHALLAAPIAVRWWVDTHGAMPMTPFMTAAGLPMAALPTPVSLPPALATPYLVGSFGFYGAILLVAVGNGLFKPILTVVVGRLPHRDAATRETAFTTFFLFNNIGGLGSVLVGGWLAQSRGWGSAFGAAALGMAISLVTMLVVQRHYVLPFLADAPLHKTVASPTPVHTNAMRPIAVVLFVGVLFVICSYQSYGLVSLFNAGMVDRVVLGFEVPPSWVQAVDPLTIMLFTPVLVALWRRGCLGHDWSPTVKYGVSFLVMATGFAALIGGAWQAQAAGKANMLWVIYTVFAMAFAQLLTTPAAMSAVTRLAPAGRQTLAVGAMTAAFGIGGWLSGRVGALAMESDMVMVLAGLIGAALAVALVVLALRHRLARLTI